MTDCLKIDVVIPAHNEAKTVASVVKTISSFPNINKIFVVDNMSSDSTAIMAANAGAIVINEPQLGMGRAIKSGLTATEQNLVLKTDADITNWDNKWLELFIEKILEGHSLVRANFDSPYDLFPLTNLCVKPILKTLAPNIANLPRLLSGTYIFDKSVLYWSELPENWAFDISILIQAEKLQSILHTHVDIGILNDKKRNLDHYFPMAEQIANYILNQYLTNSR